MDRIQGIAKKNHPGLHHSLQEARLVNRSADSLRIAASNAFYQTRLKDRADELQTLCTQFFGRPMKVEIVAAQADGMASGKTNGNRPQSRAESREAERLLKHAALNHPAINMVLREMQGEILEIRPLGNSAGESR
jgi:hypothetical protein